MVCRFIFITFLISSYSSVYAENETACLFETAMENFQNDDFKGANYLIAQTDAYPIQLEQAKCGTLESTYLGNNQWKFNISYQFENGTIGTDQYGFIGYPPGYFTALTSNDGNVFLFTVLGAEANNYLMSYSCNFKKGSDAIWLFYKSRVEGFDGIDNETKQKIKTILKNKNIPMDKFQNVNNNQCKN